MSNTISIVKTFVEEECRKPTSKYGYEPFPFHFIPTVKYARRLAKKLGADLEIVTIAAWLHDIGSIMESRGEHHITGAKIAGKKLEELNYPSEKIERVNNCILNHRGSVKNKCISLEEKILVDADCMSNFENIAGIFQCAYVYENLNREQARISVLKKMQNKWSQLNFKESRNIIRPKYEAAKILLR